MPADELQDKTSLVSNGDNNIITQNAHNTTTENVEHQSPKELTDHLKEDLNIANNIEDKAEPDLETLQVTLNETKAPQQLLDLDDSETF